MKFGKYSTDEESITHDGTLLSKINVGYEDIKCTVSFDITIEIVSGTKFTGKISLELPVGDIVQNEKASYEKTDFKDVIFKRN